MSATRKALLAVLCVAAGVAAIVAAFLQVGSPTGVARAPELNPESNGVVLPTSDPRPRDGAPGSTAPTVRAATQEESRPGPIVVDVPSTTTTSTTTPSPPMPDPGPGSDVCDLLEALTGVTLPETVCQSPVSGLLSERPPATTQA